MERAGLGSIAGIVRLILIVAVIGSCSPAPSPTPARPSVQPSPAAADVETTPCNQDVGATAQLQAFDEPPEPPDAPGAGPPPSTQLNPGRKPTTPVDADAVIPEQPVGATVLLPPGAQDPGDPRAVVAYAPPRSLGPSSQIAEPEVAVNGDLMLLTWNWGAAQSFDGGATIPVYLDPFAEFEGVSTDDGFCCDQLAHHVPAPYDMWLWILQYKRVDGRGGNNRVRLAVAKGDAAFRERRFSYWDITAQQAGFEDGIWFDQTKLGTTDRYLYLSINAFAPRAPDGDGSFRAAVVHRISLEQLAAGGAVTPECFSTSDQVDAFGRPLFGPYPVRNATDTMYLATHHDASTLGVWRWPDESSTPTYHLVRDFDANGRPLRYPLAFEQFVDDDGATRLRSKFSCERGDPAIPALPAPSPAGAVARSDWCRRSDDRLSSGWLAEGRLGFAWNVSQDTEAGGIWRYPWVWAIVIDETKLTDCGLGGCILDYPHIRNEGVAFQHARIAPNARGDLGGVVMMGGGASALSCVAVVRDRGATETASWDALLVERSDLEPLQPTSGDYLGIWPDGGNDLTWSGTCMTLEPGGNLRPQRPATVHVTRFGRAADGVSP